jgi:hypothetical protein
MEEALADHGSFSKVQRQLIGAYFLNEYSFEARPCSTPSIVPHPDQSDAPKVVCASFSVSVLAKGMYRHDVSRRHHRRRRQPDR